MIPLHKVWMGKAVDSELKKTLYSGFIGQGPKVEEFEKALIPWIGRKTIVSVNSCTSAIHLALKISGVTVDDEVISTPVTCTATNVPILALGAQVVWADVNPWTGNLEAESVKKKITKRTKAVMAVHWGGNPCEIDELERICREKGIRLIFDCAHALGATYKGKPVGSYGDFSCFSFQAIKHLTTGDGGLLSCKNPKDYEKAKLLRWYGIKRPANLKKDIPDWGYKFHMNDIAATIGLANLVDFPKILKLHKENAAFYADRLLSRVYNPDSAYWLFTIHSDTRDKLQAHLKELGIASGVVHERNDRYSMFKASRCKLPGVDAFMRSQLSIPVGWWVSIEDRHTIIEAIYAY